MKALTLKEVQLEWRQRYAVGGLLLYVASTVFVIYTATGQSVKGGELEQGVWIMLYWITLLFAATNAITRSFLQENTDRLLYYYTLAGPKAIILSKMIYNSVLMLLLGLIAAVLFTGMLGNPVANTARFILAIFMASLGLGILFSMIAAIASRASNNATLTAILGFPVMLPLLLFILKLSQTIFFAGPAGADLWRSVLIIGALDALMVMMALILFPYLWRD